MERDHPSYLNHRALKRMNLGEVEYSREQEWRTKGIKALAPRRIIVDHASDPAGSQQPDYSQIE